MQIFFDILFFISATFGTPETSQSLGGTFPRLQMNPTLGFLLVMSAVVNVPSDPDSLALLGRGERLEAVTSPRARDHFVLTTQGEQYDVITEYLQQNIN